MPLGRKGESMKAEIKKAGKKVLAAGIGALLALGALIPVSVRADEGVTAVSPRFSYEPSPEGTVTLDVALGCTGNIVDWLESHENDSYYLGTPYAGMDESNPESVFCPNGESGGNGQMNCTGFVGSVLRHEGADLTQIGTRLPGWYANASNWNDYVHNRSIKSYKFSSVQEALNSGILRKGDILYFEPNTWSEPDADCHIGFFWGNTPEENRFWHSSTHPQSGNQISEIVAKTADSSLYVFPVRHTGKIELIKSSARPDFTENNNNYSLAGARYGIYQGEEKITEMVTDENGHAVSEALEEGSYTVRELEASPGYAVDLQVYGVEVTMGKTETLEVQEIPQNNPLNIILHKLDAETGKNQAQGAATLEGAEFTVKYYTVRSEEDPAEEGVESERTWVFRTDAEGEIHFTEDYLVTGDEFYYQADGSTPCVPLGTVTVQETKAPEGYLINSRIFVQTIDAEGTEETVECWQAPDAEEQVYRGDLELVKVSDGDLSRLAEVPFLLTAKTTGESHILMTDKNGYASTAASWNSHTSNTNRGELPEDGIWFGESEPDDNLGALYYDTYHIEELRCEANEGRDLLEFEVTVYRDSVTVDLGTLTNDRIEIGTTALDSETGGHSSVADEAVTIIDTVTYKGLKKGQEYRLSGVLMDKETGEKFLVNGEPVTGETVFTAENSSGSVEVTFTFSAEGLAGKNVVVFEELYQNEVKLAVHEDLEDEGQTVKLEDEEVPESPAPQNGTPVSAGTPKTGDSANIMLWLFLAAGAAVSVAVIVWLKKRKTGGRI